MGEAHRQAPGPSILPPRNIVELARRVIGNLVVILHLVGDLGDAGAGDRAQIVIPPVDPLARPRIVRRPAEIGGIDIGRQPLLEPVQLVGSDKVHLAGESRVISRRAQMMRKGRDVRRELRRIVIDACPAWQLPRHEGGTGRRAERTGAVGVGKPHRPGGQRLQVGGVQKIRRPVWKQRSVQLIDHQNKDVRTCRGYSWPWRDHTLSAFWN